MTDREALFELLRRAREAEPGLARIDDDLGHAVHIERCAEHPDAMRLDFSGFDEGMPIDAQWLLPATPRPTTVHPEGIPFLAGVEGKVIASKRRTWAVWRGLDQQPPDRDAMRDAIERLERDAPPELTELVSALKEASGDRDAVRAAMEGLRAGLDSGDTRERLRAALTAGAGSAFPSHPDAALGEVFDRLIEAIEADGWTATDDPPDPGPAVFRSAGFEKGGRRRRVILSGFGFSQIMLIETAIDD